MQVKSSLAIVACWLLAVSPQDLHDLDIDSSSVMPNVETPEGYAAWERDLMEAVEDLENSRNGTARNFVDDQIMKVVAPFFNKAKTKAACSACKSGIGAAHTITQWDWTLKPILEAIDTLCRKSAKKPASVCKGIAHSSGTTVYKILRNLNTDGDTIAPMTCYAFGNICPMPNIPLKKLSFPKKVHKKSPAPVPSNKFKYILHISDFHYDREYKEGAEADCAKPICCQADSNSDEKNPKLVKRPASKWGEYNCDANKRMLNSLLNKAAQISNKEKFEMVLFTGDVPAHDMWKEAVKRSEATESEAFKMISTHFPPSHNKLYPAIGNHESVPLNQFPFAGKLDGKNFYLYGFMANEWNTWLPKAQIDSIKKAGFYSIQHSKDLKVLVLNNNLYYTYNYYALLDPTNPDPNGMFKWMISELQDAESKGSKVYISSHVPPGSTDFYQHWSELYHSIIERYSDIISGQFYGHLHTDEFEVFYSSSKKNQATAISNAYLAPSMSTMNGINPSFRVYKVDATTHEVVDYTQYYADLKKKSQWKDDVEWEVMYTARQAYGFGSNEITFPTLNSTFWHRATEHMEKSYNNFQTFHSLLNGRGNAPAKCDSECHKRFICTLRAGRSKDNCAIITPFS